MTVNLSWRWEINISGHRTYTCVQYRGTVKISDKSFDAVGP